MATEETPFPPQMDEEEKQAILEHPDVKKVMWILSDLLTGKKRLVVNSEPDGVRVVDNDPYTTATAYKHTVLVEDI